MALNIFETMNAGIDTLVASLSKVTLEDAKPFKEIILGEGSYGKVRQVSPNKVVKTGDFFNKADRDHCKENIAEIAFLSTYRGVPFIPEIHSVEVKKGKVSFYQTYAGKTLSDMAYDLTFAQRVSILPSLMIQLARALCWMKENRIVHMDIKPSNICVDNGKLTIIDWGFVCRESVFAPSYNGTEQFADPGHIDSGGVPNDCAYDMFGVGMTLIYFLTKSYVNDREWMKIINDQEEVYSQSKVKLLKTGLASILDDKGKPIYRLLKKMILLNKKKRLTPVQFYESDALKDHRSGWELYKKTFDTSGLPLFAPEVSEVIDFCTEKIAQFSTSYFIYNAASIFLRYVKKAGLVDVNKTYLFSASMYVSKLVENYDVDMARYINIEIPPGASAFKRAEIMEASMKKFAKTVLKIFEVLDWKLFNTGAEYDAVESDKVELNAVKKTLSELYTDNLFLINSLEGRKKMFLTELTQHSK